VLWVRIMVAVEARRVVESMTDAAIAAEVVVICRPERMLGWVKTFVSMAA
jgi:hypothetical protein